jgi:hypothetical protein
MWHRSLAVLASLIFATGCASIRARVPIAHPAPPLPSPAVAADMPCVQTSHGCVPLNPEVTQDNIGPTICTPGYTKTVRPSSSYTNRVKAKLLREAGLDESLVPAYELDHIVPLELGGHPRKLANLTLQPWDGEHGAIRKDSLEHRLQSLVCRGELSLRDAQYCIAEDWEACEAKRMGR